MRRVVAPHRDDLARKHGGKKAHLRQREHPSGEVGWTKGVSGEFRDVGLGRGFVVLIEPGHHPEGNLVTVGETRNLHCRSLSRDPDGSVPPPAVETYPIRTPPKMRTLPAR